MLNEIKNTRNQLRHALIFATALVLSVSYTHSNSFATTIQVQSQSLGISTTIPASAVSCLITTTASSAQCSNGPDSATAFNGDVATASGFASADISTGELKARATASTSGAEAVSFISSVGFVSITETFTVTGTGTLTAFLDLEGSWDLSVFAPFSLGFQIQASLDLIGGFGTTSGFFQEVNAAQGSFDDILTATREVSGTTSITLVASLLTQLFAGQGIIDFGNTGLLFLEASDGLSIEFSDANFLSNPTFVSAVPLPAALPLYGTGLAIMGFIGWRRRKRDVAARA